MASTSKLAKAAQARRGDLAAAVAAAESDAGGGENNKMFNLSPDFPRLMELDVDKIHPDPDQPRRIFKPGSIEEMGESVRTKGQLQPILVRPHPEIAGEFMIVFGERRWRGHRHIGKATIFAIVRNVTNVREIQLIENLQREDLTPFETARSYVNLQQEFGYTQRALADAVNKSQPEIQRVLSFLSLPQALIDEFEASEDLSDRISKSQLAEIAAEPDEARRLEMWEAAKGGATVKALRQQRVAETPDPTSDQVSRVFAGFSRTVSSFDRHVKQLRAAGLTLDEDRRAQLVKMREDIDKLLGEGGAS